MRAFSSSELILSDQLVCSESEEDCCNTPDKRDFDQKRRFNKSIGSAAR